MEIASGTRITAIDSGLQNVTKNSLKVTKSASNGGRLFQYQDVTGIPAGRYALSGYINTGGVKLPGNGAYLGIELRNSAGVLVDVAHIEETLKTDGWERRSVTFDLPGRPQPSDRGWVLNRRPTAPCGSTICSWKRAREKAALIS